MRKLTTKEERKEWVEKWQVSGVLQDEWCKAHDLSTHTFRKWVSRYRKEEQDVNSAFIPLEMEAQKSFPSSPLEVIYPNGVQVRISSLLPTDQLKSLIYLYDQ